MRTLHNELDLALVLENLTAECVELREEVARLKCKPKSDVMDNHPSNETLAKLEAAYKAIQTAYTELKMFDRNDLAQAFPKHLTDGPWWILGALDFLQASRALLKAAIKGLSKRIREDEGA